MSGNNTLQDWQSSAANSDKDPLWPCAYCDWIEEDEIRAREFTKETREAIRNAGRLVEHVNSRKTTLKNLVSVRFETPELTRWLVSFTVDSALRNDFVSLWNTGYYEIPKEYHPVLNLLANTWYSLTWASSLIDLVLTWLQIGMDVSGSRNFSLVTVHGREIARMEFQTVAYVEWSAKLQKALESEASDDESIPVQDDVTNSSAGGGFESLISDMAMAYTSRRNR